MQGDSDLHAAIEDGLCIDATNARNDSGGEEDLQPPIITIDPARGVVSGLNNNEQVVQPPRLPADSIIKPSDSSEQVAA